MRLFFIYCINCNCLKLKESSSIILTVYYSELNVCILPVNLGSYTFMLFSPKVGIYFYFSNYLLKNFLIYREDSTIISLYPLYIDPPIVTILPHLLLLFLSVSLSHSSTQQTHTRFPFAEPSESSRHHNTWCLNTQSCVFYITKIRLPYTKNLTFI